MTLPEIRSKVDDIIEKSQYRYFQLSTFFFESFTLKVKSQHFSFQHFTAKSPLPLGVEFRERDV